MTSFQDKYKHLQYMISDMVRLRQFNNMQAKNNTQNNCFLFAEAAILCVAFENFLRMVPAINAKDTDFLYNLLERGLKLFKPIHTALNNDLIKAINDIRNGILHSDFSKLTDCYMKSGKIQNIDEYFSKGFFTIDIDFIYNAFDSLIKQVDINNGNII